MPRARLSKWSGKSRNMIRLSINLPTKRRLDLKLVKSRKRSDDEPLLPSLGKILRVRKGSKISRFFRHIFEHKKIKKIFGANLAILAFLTTFIPTSANFDIKTEEASVTEAPIVIKTETGVQYPVEDIKITQGYTFFHPGIDFDGITGDPVYPISSGKVESISYSRFAYGNAVIVNHGNKTYSMYAHLSRITVDKGEQVNNGTKIGEIGATGRSFGDHLHLEVIENGKKINPLAILSE